MLTIAAGTVIGQALGLLAAPLLARLYSPSDFGVLTITSALAMSLAAVAALRLELAVPTTDSERDARSLVVLGLLAAVATAVVGTVVVALTRDRVVDILNDPALGTWLWLVPPLAAIIASFSVLNQMAIRHQRYGAVGRRNLTSSMTTLTTQLGAGVAGLRPGGLVIGLAVGQLLGTASLVRGSGLRAAVGGAVSVRHLRSVLVRYRRFPLLLGPAGLMNALGLQLPILLVAHYYGSEVTGWLGLTQRVLALPVMLIGQAVAQVYLGELSRDKRAEGGRASTLFHRTSLRLAAIAVTGAGLLLVFGPALFRLIFGPEWTTSGVYARALAVGLAAQMVSSPLSLTLVALGRQGQQLAWDASRLVLTTGAVLVCVSLEMPAITAVWALGWALALSYAGGWWLAHRAVG